MCLIQIDHVAHERLDGTPVVADAGSTAAVTHLPTGRRVRAS
jgi:hypothetical protein